MGSTASVNQFPGGGWGAAGTALSGASDIYGTIQKIQQYNREREIASLLSDPRKLSAYASRLFTGLSPGASTAVSRDLNANLGLRGMGGGGGAANQFVADAFAKIESGRQMDALRQAIGGLTGARVPGGFPTDATAKMLNVLMRLRGMKQPAETPGLAMSPVPGGAGYAGGSEAFRDYTPSPGPMDLAL